MLFPSWLHSASRFPNLSDFLSDHLPVFCPSAGTGPWGVDAAGSADNTWYRKLEATQSVNHLHLKSFTEESPQKDDMGTSRNLRNVTKVFLVIVSGWVPWGADSEMETECRRVQHVL